ncbi:hypothetical protein JG688_00004915 [Phytophthora aleatoria]|uniref:Formin-homology 2 domain-containing protein n=1 Tax=Phytophthora aleatoria TaxID=2496075 RepID=A0A8J5IQE7_9STRA|nr:hypothetical protein JG688_00004915 [Phytophthora aleatoria]
MESLRRLTSSVFDTSLVRRGSLGDVRAPDARSLELTFMTERLMVVGAPCDGPTDKKRNMVNVDDLVHFLEVNHRGHFMLFNLNALDDATADEGRQSVADKLHEQLLEFNWERDGMKAHTPPLDLIFRICYALDAWFSLDPQHVALVNCQTGKTRSGVVVACYLLFARLADDPTDAFVEFYRRRWDMKSLTPQALKKKTPPSIQRFLTGFHELLEHQKPPNDKPLLLKAVIFRQLPVELQPCVQIWDDYKLVFCTDELQIGESGEAPVLDWNEEDGFFAILWENGVELDGGFSILCSFGEDYDNADDVDASSRVLFRYADSTLFLLPGLVTLKKHDLDLMKQYEHGFDEDQFSVDLVLHENSTKKSRNSVRMDYTGNSAVRQGLIEITKHHVVLPDPAMHSNFIRMGFCETPTTFALQCSQNAPNVALDLLHSKGLSACFAQEAAELAAKKEQEETTNNNQAADSPTESDRQPALRRQTTAEIVAMQSQRSRYSIPTAVDSSLCDTCKEDDYMMRPQIKLTMDGLDPIILDFGPDAIYEEVKDRIAATSSVSNLQDDIKCVHPPETEDVKASVSEMLLKHHEVYAKYFKMLKMGLPEGAVRQKMKVDGVDERALDLGGDAPFSKLPKPEMSEPAAPVNDVKLKDDPKYAKFFKMLQMGLPEGAVRQKMQVDGVDESALDLGGDAMVSQLARLTGIKLQDDPTYAKYFKMLKMGLPEGAVRQKMKTEGVDERALDLGGDALVSELTAQNNDVKLQDDPVYSKYFKMLKMGLPEGAVRQKMATESVDVRALELGPDATVSQLSSGVDANAAAKVAVAKPKRARKKLHWQAISEDRLSNLNQQTIWEDEDDDVDFDVDMDELEALFFANQNTNSAKKNSSRGQSKALKRKQAVTLIDGKRAMNAAISLARVKLSYSEIADAVTKFDPSGLTTEQLIGINEFLPTSEEAALVSGYAGDKEMLGEAEKFIFEIAKVKRYAPRMECLVYKLSFTSRSTELAASVAHLQKAGEEVKGSRLLKTLLAMVLKLGNTLNGSGEENGIKGFTVDSLLRLGHTKAVNQKTTVLHYLVRLVKKNHPQVLDFQAELRSVPLAARESFDTTDEEFKKLEKGLASLNTELGLLEKQAVESLGLEVTIKAMQTAASEIETQMKILADGISRARDEVSSVLDYFGEDPKRNPTEFFTTLASFCSTFQRARNEVDAADKAERLKMRRSNSMRPPTKSSNGATLKVSRPILERSQTTVEKRHSDDN